MWRASVAGAALPAFLPVWKSVGSGALHLGRSRLSDLRWCIAHVGLMQKRGPAAGAGKAARPSVRLRWGNRPLRERAGEGGGGAGRRRGLRPVPSEPVDWLLSFVPGSRLTRVAEFIP